VKIGHSSMTHVVVMVEFDAGNIVGVVGIGLKPKNIILY
jgi:hypothetical protein